MTKKIIITSTNAVSQRLHTPIPSREESHRHYGGKIYPSDFTIGYYEKTNTSGSHIASRIASDFKWEQDLIVRKEERKWNKHNTRL